MIEEKSQEMNIAEKQIEEEAMVPDKSGLRPKWPRKTYRGQRIQFESGSGSGRTIAPLEVAKGMTMKKGKGYGGGFRVANRAIPNMGEVNLEGI